MRFGALTAPSWMGSKSDGMQLFHPIALSSMLRMHHGFNVLSWKTGERSALRVTTFTRADLFCDDSEMWRYRESLGMQKPAQEGERLDDNPMMVST